MEMDKAIETVSEITEEEACKAIRVLDNKMEKILLDIVKYCTEGNLNKAAKSLRSYEVTNKLREFVMEQRGF